MKKLKESILKLIEVKKWLETEELLLSSSQTNVMSVIKNYIFHKEGTCLLTGILKSLQCKTRESTSLKYKIYELVLKLIKCNEDAEENENGKLVTVLLMHVDLFPSNILVDLINLYMNDLSAGLPFYGRWTDLFGKLLSTCVSRSDIVIKGDAMTGEDYQYSILKGICSCKWSAKTTTTLLPIFRELDIPKEEMRDVIEKLREVLLEVQYQSVPPIIYHMILMGQGTLPNTVLEVVMHFFNDQESILCKESEEALEGIEDVQDTNRIEKNSMADLVEAQGTVVLHITHLAQYDSRLIKDYLKLLKNSWLPQRLFTPFNLALALSLSHIDRFKDQILDSLKSSILKHYRQSEKQEKSLWLSEALKDPLDLNKVLRATIRNCSGGWDQVSKGLVTLCFSLLESGGGIKGDTFPCQQMVALASNVLPSVFKNEPRLASDILKQLSSLIFTASSPLKYVELLGRLVKVSPLVLLDHVTLVRELLEQLVFLPFPVTAMLLNTLLPLVKLNMTLKDALVIILRKMLFSKQVDNRMAAVEGFIQILCHFRVVGTLPSSQASLSFSSTLSQISADVHTSIDNTTNEALCLELLGVLRRCFTQQNEVRSTLYRGLTDAARSNPKLAPNILRLLQQHFSSFVDLNESALNPILLKRCVSSQGENVTLVEPVGDLLSCLSRCKARCESLRPGLGGGGEEEEDDAELTDSLNEICSLFDLLTEKLGHCDMDDLEFDNASFAPGATNGKKNLQYAEIMAGVFDALIEQNFSDGALQSEVRMRQVLALFKTQKKMMDLVREKSKPVKKSGDVSKAKSRPSSAKQTISFKSVLSLSVAVKMLNVSLNGDNASNSRSVDLIKGNGDLQLYLISILDETLEALKTMQPRQREKTLPDLKAAAHLLFKECLKNLFSEDHEDDDRETTRLRHCLSTLHSTLKSFIKHYKDKLPQIFKELTGKPPSKTYESLLYYVSKSCCKLLLKVLQIPNPSIFNKDCIVLIQIIGLVTHQMELNSAELLEIQDTVNQICKDHPVTNPQLAESLIQLLLTITDQVKVTSNISRSIAREIHYRMGDIEQDVAVEETGCYKIVTESSAPAVLATLCLYCDDVSSILELMLMKLKAKLLAAEKYDEQEMNRMISLKFAVTIHALHEVFQSAIPHGPPQDSVLRTTTRFYNCLSLYVKYYWEYFKVKPNAQMSEKFEKLIHLCSTLLKENAYKMINYMHNAQTHLGRKGKTVITNRALKESKLIPALVFSMEQYENHLMQLAKKSKVNLLSGTKITTSRDFRIVADVLQVAMRKGEDEDASSDEEEEDDEQQGEREQVREEEEEEQEREDGNPPPKKRRK